MRRSQMRAEKSAGGARAAPDAGTRRRVVHWFCL